MLNANVVHTKQSQRPQCFRNVPKNILPCCKTRWSNRVRSKLTISTRVCVLFPTGVEKLLWFHSGLSSKLQWNVFRKPFYLILFLLEKNIRPQPTRCEKGTNNRNFYTDIYPIFPQVLSYYVRVFDVCGALQYFNVLSPPPPLLLSSSSSSSSDVWCLGYRDIVVTAGTVPASNVRSWVRGRDDRDRILFPVKWQPWVPGPDI